MTTLASRTASGRRHHGGINRGQAGSGWLFTAPTLILLGLFLVIPILMALWVSVSDWNGNGSPFTSSGGAASLDAAPAAVLTVGVPSTYASSVFFSPGINPRLTMRLCE